MPAKSRTRSVSHLRSLTSPCSTSSGASRRRLSKRRRKRAASAGNTGSTITVRGAHSCGPGRSQSKAEPEEGASAYDAALKEFRETGAGLRMPHYLGLLAGIHRKAGRRAAGLKLLTEANQLAERNHETWCNAMLELERGELLLLDASWEAGREADAAFKHGIDIAADQGAKTLELRASVARARHCAQRGEGQKALDMLSPIYGWFSQGFETPDLLQAKTLLGELRQLI